MKRLIGTILCGAMLGGFLSDALAAETTKSLPRKKFKLHTVNIGFQSVKMTSPRVIPHLDYQKIGVVSGDVMTFEAMLAPYITLPPDKYLWSGAKDDTGRIAVGTLLIDNFPHSESLRVGDVTKTARIYIAGLIGYGEDVWCIANAVLCPDVLDAADEATIWADGNATALGGSQRADAARHAYWNALMVTAYSMNAQSAADATSAHEQSNYDASDPRNEIAMDTENNHQGIFRGIDLGTLATRHVVQQNIVSMLDAGQLLILDDDGNLQERGLLQPSNR